MRSGVLAEAPAAFPLKSRLALRRFGVAPTPTPNNNNAPARYFLLFYSGLVLLLAIASKFSLKNNMF